MSCSDSSGVWPRVAGGCHCGWEKVTAIVAEGFQIERVRTLDVGPSWMHTNPYVLGVARAPEPPRDAAAP